MDLSLLEKNLTELPEWVEDQAEHVTTLNLTGNCLQ